MAILSFDGRVNIAVRIVGEAYPEAVLYEADGVATAGPTTKPAEVDRMQVVFGNVDTTTVIIKETGYGEFGKPELIKSPWVEDRVIDWPVAMDLDRANELKQQAGFTASYTNVTLRNPLEREHTNPTFFFGGGETRGHIAVDTVTGKVTQF